MRRQVSVLLAMALAAAGGVYVFGPSFSSAGKIGGGSITSTTPTEAGCGEDESCAAVSYESTASTGSGFACTAALASCLDLGPGTTNFIGTDGSGRIRLGDDTHNPEVWIGDGTTKLQPGNVQILNGALYLPNSFISSLGNGAVRFDNVDGVRLVTQASTPTCSGGAVGTFSTLTGDGKAYYCDGTTAQRIAVRAAWSGSLDFGNFAASSCETLTFTATGAVDGEPIASGGCGDIIDSDADLMCLVAISATNTASVRVCCHDALGCGNPAAITFSAVAAR